MIDERSFVASREADWKRLTYLCDRADVALANLTAEEFREFVAIYQKVSSDLAQIQGGSTNLALTDFLNDLVARAYSILYRERKKNFVRMISDLLANTAQTARRCSRYIALSVVIFLCSIVFSYSLMSAVPDSRSVFIPYQMEENTKAWKEGLPARTTEQSAMATGMYASHNPLVAVVSAGLSAASFGVGSLFILYENGINVGALAHEMASVNKLGFLVVSLLPHGVTELSGMIFAGAAGFVLGWALVKPTKVSRLEELRRAGKDAIVLLGTSVVMMFMAAPVEGFFSFNPNIPPQVKGLFALFMALAWAAFWIGYGRPKTAA